MPAIQDSDAPAWVTRADDLGVPDPVLTTAAQTDGLAVVILARDEADVLGQAIRSIRLELQPMDELHVVADGCGDATAAVARANGARVHIRVSRGPSAKGRALTWWLSRTRTDAFPRRRVVVLDADSRILPGFLTAMRTGWSDERAAYQARVVPELMSASPVGRLAGFSEFTEQDVNDRLFARLGSSVRLRGVGMGVPRSILEELTPQLRTSVEDAELSLLLAARGIPIRPIQDARVLDPKPQDGMAAARQRARWLRGQALLLREHPHELLHVALLSPRCWPLLGSIFLKPKALWMPMKAALTSAAWIIATRHPWAAIPAAMLSLWLGWDLACLAIGLARTPDKASTMKALVLSPIYLVVWGTSALMALVSGEVWLRARPIGENSNEAGGAGSGG